MCAVVLESVFTVAIFIVAHDLFPMSTCHPSHSPLCAIGASSSDLAYRSERLSSRPVPPSSPAQPSPTGKGDGRHATIMLSAADLLFVLAISAVVVVLYLWDKSESRLKVRDELTAHFRLCRRQGGAMCTVECTIRRARRG